MTIVTIVQIFRMTIVQIFRMTIGQIFRMTIVQIFHTLINCQTDIIEHSYLFFVQLSWRNV